MKRFCMAKASEVLANSRYAKCFHQNAKVTEGTDGKKEQKIFAPYTLGHIEHPSIPMSLNGHIQTDCLVNLSGQARVEGFCF